MRCLSGLVLEEELQNVSLEIVNVRMLRVGWLT